MRTGHDVVAVVGVDGSPSCGVARTIDVPATADRLARAHRRTLTPQVVDAVLQGTLVPGSGLFIDELRRRLRRRHIDVPFIAHDLPGEPAGEASPVVAELRGVEAGRSAC